MKREIFTINKRRSNRSGLLLAALAFLFSFQLSAQLIGWNTAALNATFGPSPFAPATLNANLTMVTGLSRGASIQASSGPANACWGGNGGWGTTDATSFYFVFKANTGYQVSLSSISAAIRRSGSGPTTYTMAYSLNGGAYTAVGNWASSVTSGTTGAANSSPLSGIAALQNIPAGTEVRFRMTFTDGISTGNCYFTGGANSLRLEGTVTAAAATCTAPSGLLAANQTQTSADLSWNTVSGATGYEYVVDQTSGNPSGAGTATTGTTFSPSTLTGGSTYYLHVRTNCGSGNYSAWTTLSFNTSALPCPAPTGLALTSTTTTNAMLSWDPQGSNTFQYVVNQLTTDPASGANTTAFLLNSSGLTPATTYYLHVRTNCGSGNFSPWSMISFTTLAPCPTPTGLTTGTVTTTTAGFSWDAQGSNGFEYVLNQNAGNPASGTAITGTTYNATALIPGVTYNMHLRTDCGGGNFSPWTDVVFTTVAPCVAPTGLAAAGTTATTSNLSWDAQGSNGFEYVVDENAADPSAAGTATTATTYNATALTPLTTYYLHVRVDCGGGNLSPWTTLSFTTLVAPCIAPTGLAAAGTTATTSNLSWDAQGSNGFEYVVDQNAADPSAAGTATTVTTYSATALTPETTYYLHVRVDCGGGNLSPWTTLSFTTLVAPCIAPTGLVAAGTTATTSNLSWDAQGSNGFEYVVDENATDPSAAGTATTATTYNATALTPETTYYLHVRVDCGGGNLSPWTTLSFTTLVAPCIAPTGLAAAGTTATASNLSWDAQGSNGFEYVVDENAADPSAAGTATTATTYNATALTPETTYYLHVRVDCGGGNLSPWTTLSFTTLVAPCIAPTGLAAAGTTATTSNLSWDAQGSNGFEYVVDENAADPSAAGTATTATTYSATALTPETTYYLHVRVDCGGGNLSPWTTLSFTTLVAPCIAPTGLAAAGTTATTSNLSWDAQGSNGFEYVVDENAADPSAAGTATTVITYNATALTPETTYYLHVRVDCGNGNFSDWTTLSFTTEELPVIPCIAPSGVSALNITAHAADLIWNTQTGITGFEYVIDQSATDPTGGATGTPNNAFAASALAGSTTYHFHVRTDCGNGNFSDWTTISFTTLSVVGIDELETVSLTAYPNPATGQVTVSGQTQGIVNLTNLKGQQLMSINLEQTATLDLSAFESGMYFLVYTNGNTTSMIKLIKQ